MESERTEGFHPRVRVAAAVVGQPSEEIREDRPAEVAGHEPAAMEEVVRGQGHENVSATHASTLEVTTDDFLTPAGDCIVAIEADRAPADFAPAFVEACRDSETTITAEIEAGGLAERVTGRGDPALTFESERSHVLRTSDYVDDRTVMVGADRSAADLDRDLVSVLADGAEVNLTLSVE